VKLGYGKRVRQWGVSKKKNNNVLAKTLASDSKPQTACTETTRGIGLHPPE
jgi:hypothetical protein